VCAGAAGGAKVRRCTAWPQLQYSATTCGRSAAEDVRVPALALVGTRHVGVASLCLMPPRPGTIKITAGELQLKDQRAGWSTQVTKR
jgi:hypothetical protein